MKVSQYSKSIVMVAAAGLAIFTSANTDGNVSPAELVTIIIAILGAIPVYFIPNLPTGVAKYAKAFVAFGLAAAQAVVLIVATSQDWSGVTSNDWLTVLLAGLAAIGLAIIPNTKPAVAEEPVAPEAIGQGE